MIIYEDTFISGNPVRINHIASLIANSVRDYIRKTGYDPDSLYLGSAQYKALKEHLLEQGYYYIQEHNSGSERFQGMEVFRVNAKDHLAVSRME